MISAGILMYRRKNGNMEFFIVHPGGPFFRNKHKGTWTIPKGLPENGEDSKIAAKREFEEETGIEVSGVLIPLGEVKQKGGKRVLAWGVEGDHPKEYALHSNHFEMEWPPKSGRKLEFPEIDQAGFFSFESAKEKINPAQVVFMERLIEYLKESAKLV